MPTDLIGTTTDQDGNKDGVKGTDIGAFEVKAKGQTAKGGHDKKAKHGKKSKKNTKKDSKKAGQNKGHGTKHTSRGKRH